MRLNTTRTVLWSCVLLAPITISFGGFSLGTHVVVILVAAGIDIARYGVVRFRSPFWVFVFIALLIAEYLLANALSPCVDSLIKSVISFFLFLGIFFALTQAAARNNLLFVERDLSYFVGIVCVSVIVEQIWYRTTGASDLIRASGIYMEPSHLALSVSPLLVAHVFSMRAAYRLFGWIAIVIIFTLSSSATLYILVPACMLVSFMATSHHRVSLRSLAYVALALMAVAMIISVSSYREDFAARLSGVTNNVDVQSNISSIVYVNGWETALQNLSNTYGIGLGFNRMGCDPRPETDAGEILERLGLEDANYNDGSFTVAKILSELGVFGVAVWIFAGYLLFRMVRTLRDARYESRAVSALRVSAVVVLVFGGFVRGTGYFSGPFVLGLFFLLSGMIRHQRPP